MDEFKITPEIASEIVYECMFDFNSTQMQRLAEYALKLVSDKRYKKKDSERNRYEIK